MSESEPEHDPRTSPDDGGVSDLETFLERYKSESGSDVERPMTEYVSELQRLAESWSGPDSETRVGDEDDTVDQDEFFGPYKVLHELGRGGQGIVYLAEDPRLGRKVALKALTNLGPSADHHLKRFRREAEVASRLDHPGICSVLDAGMSERGPYIVMRFVEGETLAERIVSSRARTVGDDGSYTFLELEPSSDPGKTDVVVTNVTGEVPVFPSSAPPPEQTTRQSMSRDQVDEILALFEKAALALHAAHEAGIVHRDIKPGNIMVTSGAQPVLLDFGLARDEENEGPTLTRTGDVFGTPAYMSPEQIKGGREVDRRTDVYSLGVTLYECLTLTRPYDEPTRQRMYQAIVHRRPADPRRFNESVRGDLRVVVETAMEKDVNRRYQTAAAFADELRRIRRRQPIRARAVPRVVRVARWAQRNPAFATAVFGVFLALAVGLVTALTLLGDTRAALAGEEAARKEAVKERDRADKNLAEYERLADVKRLDELTAAALDSWPPVPASLDGENGILEWLAQADALLEGRPHHLESLCVLRRTADSELDAVLDETRTASLERVEAALDPVLAGSALEDDLRRLAEAEKAFTASTFVWRFGDSKRAWRHDVLTELVADIATFATFVERVRRHKEFIQTVTETTLEAPEELWSKTIEAIADEERNPRYRGVRIEPQLGLIPIGKDPGSGMFEFVHVQTGVAPERNAEGTLEVTEEMGIILVLVPPGSFTIGAQKDAQGPNHDPLARLMDGWPQGGGVRTVEIRRPFLVSKYEMTQGQWLRAFGTNPSAVRPGISTPNMDASLTHPVESVNWDLCTRLLPSLGLELPSEVQWEYVCRGGTDMPWWTGLQRESLLGACNLRDRFYHENRGVPERPYESWLDDGRTFHAPVGSYRANGLGVYDVVGNLWEWCREDFHRRGKILRGGSFNTLATMGRSGGRNYAPPGTNSGEIGVRPVRRLDP